MNTILYTKSVHRYDDNVVKNNRKLWAQEAIDDFWRGDPELLETLRKMCCLEKRVLPSHSCIIIYDSITL